MKAQTARKRLLIWGVLTLLLCLFPAFVSSQYLLRIAALMVFWIGMAGSWNLMSGYTGYVDFGPVAYFGIGSYAAALVMTEGGGSFFLALPAAGCTAALVALLIGMPTLRLKGAYFAIATFAFAETMKQVTLEFDRTFGIFFFQGSHGITLPIAPYGNAFFLYCSLAVASLVLLAHHWIENSRFGYALKAVHEAEDTAELSGVNTFGVKLTAYAMSAFFLGVFGGIEAYWITYITPADVFSVHKTVQMVIMTLLGGMGTFLGPIVGAVFLTGVSEILGLTFVEYYLILVGMIIVGVILLLPRGIVGTWKERKRLRSL